MQNVSLAGNKYQNTGKIISGRIGTSNMSHVYIIDIQLTRGH